MELIRWLFGQRYELSGDGKGLLRYFKPNSYYHIHSDEMTYIERVKHRILTKQQGKIRFA